MSNPNSSGTKAPDFAKQYKEGLSTYLQFLPKELQQELGYRNQYDQQFIDQQMALEEKNRGRLAQEQLTALQDVDPQWLATHQTLGGKVQQALERGYVDPRQEAAYQQYSQMAGKVDPRYEAAYGKLAGLAGTIDPEQAAAYHRWAALAGQVDPRQEAAYKQWAQLAGKQAQMAGQVDPTRAAEYKALGKQVTGDTLRGTTADPRLLREMTQAIQSQRPGLSYGEAQDMATAVYTGQRGQALQQQRQQAGEQFLGQQTTAQQQQQSLAQGMQGLGQFYGAPSMLQQRQQSLGQFYGAPSLTQQRQQSLGAFTNVLDPNRMSQAELAQFYGQTSPEQNAMALAGTYIQPSNSITGQLNQIPGVQAPRSFGYVNPNAGYQGVQFGLQNFQNQLAYQNSGGGGGNPWTNALQGAATGAQYGSVGGGYGAAGGAATGLFAGLLGYPQYSDERLKNNLSRTGLETPDGIPIVEYDYNGKRWRGVIAQEVEKVRPDAVHHYGNGTLGVFYSKLGIELQEVQNG